MQEQISDQDDDAQDAGVSVDPKTYPEGTRPIADRAEGTTYVILSEQGDGVWEVVHSAMQARSTRDALQTYVEDQPESPPDGTVLVAVASRSWKPTTVGIRTETITRVVIGE